MIIANQKKPKSEKKTIPSLHREWLAPSKIIISTLIHAHMHTYCTHATDTCVHVQV